MSIDDFLGRRAHVPVHINVAALHAVRTRQRQKQLLIKRLFAGDAFRYRLARSGVDRSR